MVHSADMDGTEMARAPRLKLSTSLWRIAANAASMLASDVINRATTFALYALVARSLGAYEFGQLSLSLTLFYTFQILSVAGLKTLVTREVAKFRERTDEMLVNGSIVVLGTALASVAALAVFLRVMSYTPDTSRIVLLLSLGLLPYALTAINEAIFQGWERMRLIAIANIPVNVIKIALSFAVLFFGSGLTSIVLLLVGSYAVILMIEWVLILTQITVPRISVNRNVMVWMLRSTVTFLGIDGIIAVTGSLNVILLSKMRNETEVGLFNAGTQLMVPVALIYQSIVLSVFPVMCRRFEPTMQGIKRIGERVIELMLGVALPTSVGLFLLSTTAISLLYGSGLDRAASSMQIMVWGLILSAMTSILGQVLVASMRERVTLRIVVVDLVVSVVTGVILIHQFGYVGAAATALITRAVDLFLHYRPVANLFPLRGLMQAVWKPATATAVMTLAYVAFMKHGLVVSVAASCVFYVFVFLALMIADTGSMANLKVRYRYLWSE
jgi:O-antigen/teichoic acid export membrane protein